jgi:hypothetical protein
VPTADRVVTHRVPSRRLGLAEKQRLHAAGLAVRVQRMAVAANKTNFQCVV